MKVAIVYDRVNKWGGAERVLLALHEMYPDAPLYTSVYNPERAKWAKKFPKIKTSFLQNIPYASKNHEFLALFMPLAFRFFDFTNFDLVISVTSEFAKSIKTKSTTLHICYCLTPTRYLWSGYEEYFKNRFFRTLSKPAVWAMRFMDQAVSKNPDVYIAISTEIQKRIKKYYKRNSYLVYPPVNVGKWRLKKKGHEDHFLLVSRLDYGYKKVELVIRTFNKLGIKLVIVGEGRESTKLRQLAKKNIHFAGRVTDKKLSSYYLNAKALIMPQEEDFGIVAVEAQAHGTPVIAYKMGGVKDTVLDGKTGIFFDSQTVDHLEEAIKKFENKAFKGDNLFTQAKKFSLKNFKQEFGKIVEHEIAKR